MINRQPLSLAEREYLYQRKQAGASHAEVARDLHCSPETVRKRWKAYRRGEFRRKRGRPSQGILSTYPGEVREAAIALKKAHPHWGAANILLRLKTSGAFAGQALPSPSRLAVLFKSACPQAVQSPRRTNRLHLTLPHKGQVHQRWQVDTKEKVRLQNGGFASILDIRDPIGALMISSQAFVTTLSARTCRKLKLGEIQQALRQGFAQWGRPGEVQTDHEDVFAGAHQADFPSPFTLWLVGLGIRHTFSRRNRPTDQSQVERNHRTIADMSWRDQPPIDLEDLQQQLDQCCSLYNQAFPCQAADCDGLPPLVRFPQAIHSGRPYLQEIECDLFDLGLVDQYLATLTWVRKVSCNGVVFLGDRKYYLGRAYKSQQVKVHYLPDQRAFCFETEQAEHIRSIPANGLQKPDLLGFTPQVISTHVPCQLTLPLLGV
jgi:transposase-like protein